MPFETPPPARPVAVPAGGPVAAPRPQRGVPPLPARPLADVREAPAPWSTGRQGAPIEPSPGVWAAEPSPPPARASLPAAAPPRRAATTSPSYGDWTRPSRSESAAEEAHAAPLPTPANAPSTTLIPERTLAGRTERETSPATGPGTGPVGGRAAVRAERDAAEAARRRATATPGPAVSFLEDHEDDEEPERTPRRLLQALVAMTVVALGVLGVYSFTSPQTRETAARSAAEAAPARATPSAVVLPPLPVAPEPVVAAPPGPVRAPVTVLNATPVAGLAADIAGAVKAAGWETPGIGAYTNTDVAATTVFFTEGDETQRQAAVQLVDQFPQLQGPAVRFFEVPDIASPGLVVVATGEWRP